LNLAAAVKAPREHLLLALLAVASATAGCGSSATTTTTATGPSATRCQPTLGASSPSFGAAGGSGSLTVSVARECAWSAGTDANWIAITDGATGQGDGSIVYRVSANAVPSARRGAITVGDQRVDIGQDAAACEFSLSSPSDALAAAGARAAIDVRTLTGCSWQAHADQSWAAVEPGSGNGTGVISVTLSPNAGPERTVGIGVASQRVTIRQLAAVATPPPTPPSPPPAPPPPPPPPPPAPTPIDLNGDIDNVRGACPAVQFTLKGYLVVTSAATDFTKGNCKDLKDDRGVKVHGELIDSKTVTASKVEIRK